MATCKNLCACGWTKYGMVWAETGNCELWEQCLKRASEADIRVYMTNGSLDARVIIRGNVASLLTRLMTFSCSVLDESVKAYSTEK